MRKLFLLRGAPGSGKSSFIARHHLLPYAISGDAIRLLLANLTVYYDQKTDILHQGQFLSSISQLSGITGHGSAA